MQRSKSRESGRQTVTRLWWMVFEVDKGREVGRRGQIRIMFVEEQCFKFGMKELKRDGKGIGLSSFLGCVRYFSQQWRKFVPKSWTAMDMELLENLSDEVTKWRSNAIEWKMILADPELQRRGWQNLPKFLNDLF